MSTATTKKTRAPRTRKQQQQPTGSTAPIFARMTTEQQLDAILAALKIAREGLDVLPVPRVLASVERFEYHAALRRIETDLSIAHARITSAAPIPLFPEAAAAQTSAQEAPADAAEPVVTHDAASASTEDTHETAAQQYRRYQPSDRPDALVTWYASVLGYEAPKQPSTYQATIFDFIVNGTGNGVVNAVAGSGKTTTLVYAAKLLRASGTFVAFNKHIADELKRRLPASMSATTIHSVGMQCLTAYLGRARVDSNKYRKLCDEAVNMVIPFSARAQAETLRGAAAILRKLCDFSRMTLTSPDDPAAMRAMCEHFGIEIEDASLEERFFNATLEVLIKGAEVARQRLEIDFTDMLYLPYLWNLTPPQVKHVFVDEAQDLNRAQLALVLKLCASDGRMLFVGDPRQSIYGFAGADSDSFWNIYEATNAVLLPLSVCYRCPSSHVALARDIVPEIEAAPNAQEGTIAEIKADAVEQEVKEGDLILCRLTAPLIAQCMSLIAAEKPARVRGRDISKQLADIVRTIETQPGFQWDGFGFFLQQYEDAQAAKIGQRENCESALESLHDRCDAVRMIFERYDAPSAAALIAKIESLFSDDKTPITLSTVHRAKGLENGRVFILKPDKLPLVWPKQQEWEARQESNLRYVALTRAQDALIFIRD